MSTGLMGTQLIVHTGTGRRVGDIAPGEGWYAAARRVAGAPVVAVDLSGEVKRFEAQPQPGMGLRPMVPGDLRVLARWLGEPPVRRWFAADGDSDLDSVRARYRPDLEEGSGTDLWVVELNGRSVGFCQDYLLRDHPDYAVLAPDLDALGVDYAIGVPALIGDGSGTRMLSTWCQHAQLRHPGVRTFFAAPDHRNTASRRVLQKVGFVEGVWFDEPQPDGSVTTMVGHAMNVARVLGTR